MNNLSRVLRWKYFEFNFNFSILFWTAYILNEIYSNFKINFVIKENKINGSEEKVQESHSGFIQ